MYTVSDVQQVEQLPTIRTCVCVSECGNVNTKEIHFVVVVIVEEEKKTVSMKMHKYTALPCSPSFMRLYECDAWCSCAIDALAV